MIFEQNIELRSKTTQNGYRLETLEAKYDDAIHILELLKDKNIKTESLLQLDDNLITTRTEAKYTSNRPSRNHTISGFDS